MILLLNTSLKVKSSNTEYFLGLLESEIQKNSEKECKSVSIRHILKDKEGEAFAAFAEELKTAEALVIGAPLYVDGLPAQAVKLLEMLLENYKGQIPKLPVYVVSNLGFYEAEQIKYLLDMVRNWCERMGLAYGGGLAIGAGPMVRALSKLPIDKGLLKDAGAGLGKLSYAIVNRKRMKNYYVKTMIPRVVYLQAAHASFRKTLKENGVK